ncbi:hypothetical protein Golob_017444 [Gossypium lobatum]|uniref:Uncharacterized protein n=1 Tax=Gossypium lobatum TaxID=34289 RepID=A0A7J8M788_9ROSI|nr:hypothetical protein [Gossypium lobatum]
MEPRVRLDDQDVHRPKCGLGSSRARYIAIRVLSTLILYVDAGPIQFVGPYANDINYTLMLELGAQFHF